MILMLTQISQISQNYSYAECFVSRKSRQSHEGCVASLAAVGFAECLHGTIRECNDANFVRLPLAPSGGEHVS